MDNLLITLRAARINRGLKLKDVAKYCSKSIDTIIKYEKDSTDIPRDLMIALLELYQIRGDNIFFGRESDFIGKINRLA